MTHNDVLRSVRYLLNIPDAALIDIIRLAEGAVSKADIDAFLKKEDEEGYRPCGDEVMARFLNGLVIYKRGRDESRGAQPLEVPVTNNVVLKKLRVAFQLKDSDIITLLQKTGFQRIEIRAERFFPPAGPQELSRLRRPVPQESPEGVGLAVDDVSGRARGTLTACRRGSRRR